MRHRSRLERAEQLGAAEVRWANGQTRRQVAAELGVARTTLHDWCRAAAPGGLPPEVAAGLSTPAGVQWLHRLVMAAHWVITLRGAAGVRMVCEFLELSGLSGVVGASYGSQRAVNAAMQDAVVALAQDQRATLAAGMPAQQVTICADETYHPAICLVAIEPVSGFILLEQYAPDRTAATWTRSLATAMAGLAVTVIQGTSDEAGALRRHIEKDLHAQHASDLFHGQYEVSKGTSLHLARQVRQCAAAVATAQMRVDAERMAQREYAAQDRRPRGRPPAFAARLDVALTDLAQADMEHAQAQARQTEARDLIRELGTLYHPYDVDTGQLQPVARVAARFAAVWARLSRLAEAADLPTRAREHLAKAQRLTVHWLASLTFFFATLEARVAALDLPPTVEDAVLTQLIPALYLERTAARSTHAATRHRLLALSTQLLAPLRQPTHPLQTLAPATRQHVETVAGTCADLFQRSSSCVEGRNGQLSLYHHGCHRLSDRKLSALTAIHNFDIRRPDGTTAAERFFGRAHPSLFEQVLARVSQLPPPRRRRPRPATPAYLTPVAA